MKAEVDGVEQVVEFTLIPPQGLMYAGAESPFRQAEEEAAKVVKVNRFDIKPMTVDEAMLQLEMLGHSFYMFTNGDTNQINVIYKRKDGNYGLIEPEC